MPSNAANPATGTGQPPASPLPQTPLNVNCEKKRNDRRPGKAWDHCMVEQLCAMVKAYNESPHRKRKVSPSPSKTASKVRGLSPEQSQVQNAAYLAYTEGLKEFSDNFAKLVAEKKEKDHPDVVSQFHSECQHRKWAAEGGPIPVPRSKSKIAMSPDHMHPAGLGGPYTGQAGLDNLKWADSMVNSTVGRAMSPHDPEVHPGGIKAHPSCNCS
jgi:hypothetical protein